MHTEKLVWNGCDGYMLWADAVSDSDYRTDDAALYSTRETFRPFDAEEIDPASLPVEDGETNYDGIAMLPNGRCFRLK